MRLRIRPVRFSIPSLMALMAVAAVALWWLAAPSVTASRFVTAVNDAEYTTAVQMFIQTSQGRMLSKWGPVTHAQASMLGLSFGDMLKGRRRVQLIVTYDGLPGQFSLEASIRGIHLAGVPAE